MIHAGRAMISFFQEGPVSLAVSGVWRLFLAKTEVGDSVVVGGVRGTWGGNLSWASGPGSGKEDWCFGEEGLGQGRPAPGVGKMRPQQLREELDGQECSSSQHLSPGL